MPDNTPTVPATRLARLTAKVPAGVTLIILAAVCGVAAGVGAWVLKFAIGHLAHFIFSFGARTGCWWIVGMLPLAGIMMAVLYQRLLIGHSIEHGTERLGEAIALQQYSIRPSMCVHPILGSIITLGFGGSAGAEGPVAYSGAAIGSNLARMFGVTKSMQGILVGCGAGAGIAGIFKAPVAGMLFTLEVLKQKLNTMSVLALMISALAGGITCYVLTGFTFDVKFLPNSFFDPKTLGWVALLGVFCGIYSVYYNRMALMLRRFFEGIRNRWLRAAAGSALLATCILFFPAFFGEGYGTITELINGDTNRFFLGGAMGSIDDSTWALIVMAFAVAILKVFATISTNSSGGIAGDFTPTVFAGVFAGLLYVLLVNKLFDANLPVGLFCLFGAAGAFSGIIHAPLMAIFLASEIVGNGYGFIMPLALTSFISYIVVKVLTPTSAYSRNRHDDLDALMRTPDTSEVEKKV